MVKMKLHILLEKHRLSQRTLAQETGIGYATINGYTSNTFKHIVRSHVDILCNYFNCEITDLIEYSKGNK
jgi:putative transcriptional regulator